MEELNALSERVISLAIHNIQHKIDKNVVPSIHSGRRLSAKSHERRFLHHRLRREEFFSTKGIVVPDSSHITCGEEVRVQCYPCSE